MLTSDYSLSRISETVQSLALKIDLRELWLAQNRVTYLYKKNKKIIGTTTSPMTQLDLAWND